MSPYRTVGKWVTPDEAGVIASHYRNSAEQIRSTYLRIRDVGNNLDSNWVGNAKNVFFAHYGSLPDEISRFADTLEQMANDIASMKVWVEEQEWFDDLPGGRGSW